MLQVWLLGQFEIKLDGRRIVLSARTAQSLLAFLMLSAGTPHRREKLAGLFWSDLPEENARRNLRTEVWRIRKALVSPTAAPVEYILGDDFTLTFNRDAPFWLDASQLQRPESDLESLTSNLSLYRGELLPGMYDDWVSLERERLQAVFEGKMQALLEQLINAQRWNTVIEWSERWIALGQTPEPAYRALMVAHGALGNLSQVALDYERCVEALRDDLDVEPSGDTRALYETLTKGGTGDAMYTSPRIATPLPVVLLQPSGTITFLFSDIEGSTRLLEQLGDDYATLLADQRDLMRALLEKFNGHEVDTQGDSFFFAFFRAADAVNFAADAQRALSAHKWPHDATLRVRMGLHTGEPMLARTGYVGMDVHRAARIGASGHGGQVLLSQTTSALVENQLPAGAKLVDLGEHRLKDLRYPVQIIQLSIEGLPSEFPPLKVLSSGIEPPAPGEPPFKGLEFFDEKDAALFFGREELTAKLLNGLRQSRFLAVIVGASGSGKSSLVRAGVVPALKQGAPLADRTMAPAESGRWTTHILTPTAHPLEALATALTRDTESVTATATLVDDLTQDPRALHFFIQRRAESQSSVLGPHYLLVIDQFEELFTLCRDQFEREAFIDNLLTALSYGEGGGVTLMLTIRADFYAHLAQYPELRDAVAKHQEFIGPMTGEELRRAMEEPAKRAGWEFEPGLVDLILRDVGDEPGALPLLSHALLETWKRRSGHILTLKGYHDAGGVRGAIAQTAETTFQHLTPEQQAIARNIFLRLTELGEGTEDTRRRAPFDELIPHDETAASVHAVLRLLADARLITLNADSAEVAHEALIREWPQLRAWLNQDRDGLRLHRQITEAAQEWELLERDPGALYRGARLAQAREFASQTDLGTLHVTLNARERAFLEASAEQEEREATEILDRQKRELEQARKLAEEQRRSARRLRWFAAGLALFLLLALGAAWFASNQSDVAYNNFVTAERIRLASQAQIALDNGEGGDLPALLSLSSLKYGYSPEADASLLNALKRGFTRQIYRGHTALTGTVDFSPDGKKMVTTSNDGTARLWDVETGKELSRFAPSVRILDTAIFAPDGRHIVVGGPGNVLRLWDTATNQEVRQYIGLDGGAWGADVSSDGRYAVTADNNGAKLYDFQTGVLLREFHQSVVASLATFSPDNRLVATANGDKTSGVWEVATGKELQRISHDADVIYVAFSPDGRSLFTTSGNNGEIWDVQTGARVQKFVGHGGPVVTGAFSLDGRYIATASVDKTARLWDVATGKSVKEFIGHTGGIFDLKISPDGHFLLTASADTTARLWEIQSGTEPQHVKTCGLCGGLSGAFGVVTLSPDGQFTVTNSDSAGERREKDLSIWNTQTGGLRTFTPELTVGTSTLSVFALSPDNRLLLGGGDDGVLRLWDLKSGKLLHQLKGHSAAIRSGVFSGSRLLLLTGSDDNTARLWDAQSGKELHQFLGHTAAVRAIAFSADGKFVLTGSDDTTARLWDAETGKELRQFVGHTAPLRALAFSPDGKVIVTGGDDQTVRVWDTQTEKEQKQLIGHTGQVSQVTFSPDGQFVLTGSSDQTARLWNIQTGQLVREFVGHVSPVSYIGFSDGGHTIVTGDTENAYRWRASLEDVTAFACAQLTRDLTADERVLYRIADNAPSCAKFAAALKPK